MTPGIMRRNMARKRILFRFVAQPNDSAITNAAICGGMSDAACGEQHRRLLVLDDLAVDDFD